MDTLYPERTSAQPRDGVGGRIGDIDVLRGFGLFGVAICNGQIIAGVASAHPAAGLLKELDGATAWVVELLFAAKFYPLMAFLFGYSYRLQEADPRYAGPGFHRRQTRRLCGLLLLGVVNAVLIFSGDILTTYAVLGFLVLLVLGRMSPRSCLVMAIVCVAVVTAELLVYAVLTAKAGGQVPAGPSSAVTALYRHDAVTTVIARLHELPGEARGDFLMAPDVLGTLLVGLAAGHVRFFERGLHRSAAARRAGWSCLALGLAGSVAATTCQLALDADSWHLAGLAIEIVTAPALTAAYALALLALVHNERLGRLPAMLAAAGRMSLTNYLGQSLLLSLVFTGYGLGLYARAGATFAAAAALAVYSLGLYASSVRHRQGALGPAESFLRHLTFGPLPAAVDSTGKGKPASGL